MGILVSSYDVLMPERIGIKVIKKPKVTHFKKRIAISENSMEFTSNMEYVFNPIPNIIFENKTPLVNKTIEKSPVNKTREITTLIILGMKR